MTDAERREWMAGWLENEANGQQFLADDMRASVPTSPMIALCTERAKTLLSIAAELRSALAHVDALGREKGELADLVKYMTPTEAMVERAAVAMWKHENPTWNCEWTDNPPHTQSRYLTLARRALTAALGGGREGVRG